MARKRTIGKRIRQALEAPLMRLGLAVVPRLPRWAVRVLARGLGTAAYVFSARSRRLGRENLDLAFGGTKTAAEKRRILRRSLQNFSLVMLDLLWFTRDSAARMERWFVPAPGFRESMAGRAARVGVTGHFGNWELIGRYWALQCGSTMAVAMPLKNAAVDALLQRAREVTGQQVVPREGALKKLVRHLRAGGTVGLLLDQNTAPEEGGVFVEFFGKPVAVSPAAGLLAPMTGASVLFGYALPQPDGTYLGEMPHVIPAAEVAALDRADAAREITRRITLFYEEAIRARPEGWLWSYKRWRYIPAGVSPEGFPSYANPPGD
ncbi:MAG TPA: lysophospholipid acyltransferase family protein [Kiritimatiellia bacterium]|nr:lysophospholipid acyltransferase family protein [Kiritimatiellia bacterium]HRX06478.1 lysophospholipid acyltransferase family protein [Kiritimatiellia bacterium]